MHGDLPLVEQCQTEAAPVANNDMIGGQSIAIDGVEQHDKAIPIVDDRQEHSVEVRIHVAEG